MPGSTFKKKYSSRKKRSSSGMKRYFKKKKSPKEGPPKVEVHGVDVSIDTTAVSSVLTSNATMTPLNLISATADYYGRIGRKINLKSVRIKGCFTWQYNIEGISGDLLSNCLRIMLVYDKQTNGVLPTFDQIIGGTNNAGTESTTLFDAIKWENMSRFKILKEEVIPSHPGVIVTTTGGITNLTNRSHVIDWYVKLKNLETVYGSNSAFIADINTGGLYFVAKAENALSVNRWAIVGSRVRLRYWA